MRARILRALADLLTASRIVLAFALVGLSIYQGADAIGLAVALLIIGWTTDTRDAYRRRTRFIVKDLPFC